MGPDTLKPGGETEPMIIVKVPPLTNGTQFLVEDVKIRKGQWINKGQLMIVLKTKDNLNQESSLTKRIKSETSGKVIEVCVKKGEETSIDSILARISLASCTHSTLMKNMCADCGADLEQEEQHLGMIFVSMSKYFYVNQGYFYNLIGKLKNLSIQTKINLKNTYR